MTGLTLDELLVVSVEVVFEDGDALVQTTDVSRVTVTVTSLEIVAGPELVGLDLDPGHVHADDPVPVDHAPVADQDLAPDPALVPSLDPDPNPKTARGDPDPETERGDPEIGGPDPRTGKVNVVGLDQSLAPNLEIESQSLDLDHAIGSPGLSLGIRSPLNDGRSPGKVKVPSQDRGQNQSQDPSPEKEALNGMNQNLK